MSNPVANQKPLPARSEVDPAFTWNLTALFETPEAYRAEFAASEKDLEALTAYRGRLAAGARTLGDFMDLYWAALARMRRLGAYANLPVNVDQGDVNARAQAGQFQGLAARFATGVAFVGPELLAISPSELKAWQAQDERLDKLARYFQRLEESRDHVRSAEIEALLGSVSDAFGAAERAYNALANGEMRFEAAADSQGTVHEVERSTYPALRASSDRTLRRNAYDSYTGGFLKFSDTLTELYLGRVKQSVFTSRARGFTNTVEEKLKPKEVPLSVLDAVVNTFKANLGVWHRYFAARRRILKVEKLEEADVFAPLDPTGFPVPYQTAIEWNAAGMAPLGEEYVSRMRKGLTEERWVDVYPNRGKRDGAFAHHPPGVQPYIMVSYQDDLASMSTLAHELGHAMHGVLMNAVQPLAYTGYAMVIAETASNFNQALVRSHLLEELTDPVGRMAVLEEAFQNFHRYFFIMPTLVRFELEVHAAVERGEGLTSARLNSIMRGLFQEGYGGEIVTDERTGTTWAQFGHLFEPFYTFQYAAGIAAAAALADDVYKGVDGSVERYLSFLRAGASVTPLEAWAIAGLDFTTPEPIERAFKVLEGYVTELEKLAG